ncbi:MAG: VOC family protein [Chloroflexota bacterium]|nr:VOC family protein [Chloroflexota bacterium]
MTTARYAHLAITVPDLEEAEAYYRRLFQMEVVTREASTPDGDAQLPPDKGWVDARRAGIELYVVALRRAAFVLALFDESSPNVPGGQGTAHRPLIVGLVMGADDIGRVLRELKEGESSDGSGEFQDRYGITWQLSTADRFVGAGELAGRWLAT